MGLRWWTLLIAGFVLASRFSVAQDSDWESVKQLPQGQEVKVVVDGGRSYRGTLQSITDDVIELGNDHAVPRRAVRRVLSKNRGHRGRNALIGAAIGGGAGLGVGAAVDNGCSRTSFFCTGNRGKAIATPLFGILGLAIGAALPSGSWHEVYRSK